MRIVVHDEPVWRNETNWIARIALEPFGFEGLWEQVWLRRIEADLAQLCCIPFRAYGARRGDRGVVRGCGAAGGVERGSARGDRSATGYFGTGGALAAGGLPKRRPARLGVE